MTLALLLQVVWSASLGTVVPVNDSQARYTAPANASGAATVAASTMGHQGTSTIKFAAPGIIGGRPFGPYGAQAAGYPAPFTLSLDSYSASTLITRLDAAATARMRLVLALTGGAHDLSLTNGVFDPAKWGARMQSYNTAAIRQAIAARVADGTILGAVVMDEPQVSGAGDGNTWGPAGTMTKVRVDSLCSVVQQIFPTLNAGVVHDHAKFEPTKSYRVCQFLVDQWSAVDGDVTAFRDAGLALGARDHLAILFSMNVLNGGQQDKDGTWDCAGAGQNGVGTYSPNCRMTAADVKAKGWVLSAGCGLTAWRWDSNYFSLAAIKTAAGAVSDSLAKLPAKPCRRTA